MQGPSDVPDTREESSTSDGSTPRDIILSKEEAEKLMAQQAEQCTQKINMNDFQKRVDIALCAALHEYTPTTLMDMAMHMTKLAALGNPAAWNPTIILKIMSSYFRISDTFDGTDELLKKIMVTFKVLTPEREFKIIRQPLGWFFHEIKTKLNADIEGKVMCQGTAPWIMFARLGYEYQMENPIKIGIQIGHQGKCEASLGEDSTPLKSMEEASSE